MLPSGRHRRMSEAEPGVPAPDDGVPIESAGKSRCSYAEGDSGRAAGQIEQRAVRFRSNSQTLWRLESRGGEGDNQQSPGVDP